MAERTKLWVCKMQFWSSWNCSYRCRNGQAGHSWQGFGRTGVLQGREWGKGTPCWPQHSPSGHQQGWQEQGLVTPSANSQDKQLSMTFRVHPGNLFKSRRRWDQRSATVFYFKLNSWFMEEGRLLKPKNVTIRCGSNFSLWYRRRASTMGKVIFSGWGPFFARGPCWPLEFP